MMSRRALLAAGSFAAASCARREPYFGKVTPPPTQTLIYEIEAEPSTLDPATCLAGSESYVMPALFEGLLSADPDSLQTRAALATHYEVDAGLTEFTFFLRGHANPRGMKLPGAGMVNSRAFWSDGQPVMADDFVHAWRRVADPTNGGTYADFLHPVANGKEIAEGKARPDTLGVRAIDALTLHVTLTAPAAHFLKLATDSALAAIPHHAVATGGSSWTDAGRMPSCGPFIFSEWKPYDRIVLRKNKQYYNAHRVQLEQIVFVPVTDGATGVNLYKAGNTHAMHGRAVPPLWITALSDRKDFHRAPAYRSYFYPFNTTQPPFDNPLVRYAFHMATDKEEIVRFLSGGQTVARSIVPPALGYESIRTLPIEAGARVWDVLSYDPEAARALMRLAGAGRLVFDLTFPNGPRSKEIAQILQKQWRAHLGAEVRLIVHETNVWIQTLQALAYRGIIECNWMPGYVDPNGMLELFDGRRDGSGWKDAEFRQMVATANAEPDPAARMRKLAACEERLLRAMPVLPLFFDSYAYLQKPYVKGMRPKLLDLPDYKDVWIDTNWRPS